MIRNFSLDEFAASETAVARRINNALPEDLEPQAWSTLQMMQAIRDHLSAVAGRDVPISITSGYRSPALNAAVKGSATSDHVRAMAVDFKAPRFGTTTQVVRELSRHVDALGIGQLILEYPERGSGSWVHVSTRKPAKQLNRVITITASGTFVGVRG